VARVLVPERVLALALDVLLGRPRNVGGVLLVRIKRALAGSGELLTRCRASWPIGRFLGEVARDSAVPAPPTATATVSPPRRERVDEPGPVGGGSFDDLLRGIGLGDLARRATA
ncbi:MAG: hypothetical protein WBO45_18655, partial [Planctomycetota bacterium]